MFRIFAYLSPRTLGDFVAYAQVAASIRDLFDDASLAVYYRDDRPYKKGIVSSIPNANIAFTAPDPLMIEGFDCHWGRPTHSSAFWETNNLQDTDLFLSGHMMNELMLNSLPIRVLRPHPKQVTINDYKLIANGLDPTRWFATVYWKEDGYNFRSFHPVRTITDPTPYLKTIAHIVTELGGQVVRLGHPTPTELPKIPGVVDLAKVPGSEYLQMYAVARSRFLLASASGPAAYGPAFGVPTVNTDQNLCLGVWGKNDYVLTQGIVQDGVEYRQFEAFDRGLLFVEAIVTPRNDIVYRKNTAEELIAAANEMVRVSEDCPAWRQFVEHSALPNPPNKVSMPLPRNYRRDLVIPPSQR
jgi:putative glycosyltransferase (TIGR04372 family)